MKTKILTFGLTAASLLLFTDCKTQGTQEKNSTTTLRVQEKELINAPDFAQRLQEHDGILLDVRTPEEYQEGHLKDAMLINFKADDFTDKINTLDKSQTVYLYCRSGGRSAKAAEILKANGFSHIVELKDGIQAWEANGLPIEE